jgi:hypothetical protein
MLLKAGRTHCTWCQHENMVLKITLGSAGLMLVQIQQTIRTKTHGTDIRKNGEPQFEHYWDEN